MIGLSSSPDVTGPAAQLTDYAAEHLDFFLGELGNGRRQHWSDRATCRSSAAPGKKLSECG